MSLPRLRQQYEIYNYKEWRSYFLFHLRQYRQGLDGGNKRHWQQGLATLRQARNEGLAR